MSDLPTWIVAEKRYRIWTFRAKAASPAEALRLARSCGLTEPASVTREQPSTHHGETP